MMRPPIRLRLALWAAAGAAVLLSVVGGFGYERLERGFSHDLDLQLRQHAQDLIGPVSASGASQSQLSGTGFVERGESFAEVVTPRGEVLDATSTLGGRPLLSAAEAARAARGTVTFDRGSAPGLDEPARLLATPFTRGGRTLVLVVGDTRENGLEDLRRVRDQLVVGIPVLVLLTFLGAYGVAGAALRPVEEMRRRAAGLTAVDPSLRLPVPPGDDELTRLGETLNALLARVEATLERERTFVSHASHELRTPLALLRTELELAVRRPRPAGELVNAIQSARDEVDRLQRLSEGLLLLASAGEAGVPFERERVFVAEVFAAVRERFAATVRRQGRELLVQPTDAVVLADRRLVEQAVGDLVANAVDHGDGTVSLVARVGTDGVELVVTDEGPGFSDELLDRGADRFVRGPWSQGAGLGLAIVSAIAAAQGGTAGFGNRPGGAEAWLTMPPATTAPTVLTAAQ